MKYLVPREAVGTGQFLPPEQLVQILKKGVILNLYVYNKLVVTP